MAIEHPTIAWTPGIPPDPEQIFVEEAFRMLSDSGYAETLVLGRTIVHYAVSERVDMPMPDSDESITALRVSSLPGMPVLELCFDEDEANPNLDLHPLVQRLRLVDGSGEYEFLALETADLTGDIEWQGYMTAIVNVLNPGVIDIVDSRTGKPASQRDVILGVAALQLMRDELRGMHYIERIGNDGVPLKSIVLLDSDRSVAEKIVRPLVEFAYGIGPGDSLVDPGSTMRN